MSHSSTFKDWYERPRTAVGSWSSNVAEEAFQVAKVQFESDLTRDPKKVAFARSEPTLEAVQDIVQRAKEKYNKSRGESEAQTWLVKLSQRIHLYGGVLDVFAQHHPEYVALAWGSMKFLLMAVVNHEEIIATLAKAIAEIAWNLPRVELHALLYPTDRMKEAVTNLYAHILKFLIRARGWYEQGRLQRLIHSITRPAELRYRDLLDEITSGSLLIDKLALSGSQAELRDLHQEFSNSLVENRNMRQRLSDTLAENKVISQNLKTLLTAVEGMKIQMTSHWNISVDTNHRLTDMQYNLSMGSLPNVPMLDPARSFQYHHSLKQQRSRSATVYAIADSFWRSQRLQKWSVTNDSAIAVISGGTQTRFTLRDLCVGIIEQLHQANVPVVYTMRAPQIADNSVEGICAADILKSLSRQVIEKEREFQTEKSMGLVHTKFHEAVTTEEWFSVLEASLTSIKGHIYIIVDLGLVDHDKSSSPSGFPWTQAFERFFKKLSERVSSTKTKVLLVNYGSLRFQLSPEERARSVIPLKVSLVTARQRKAGRGPRLQQKSLRLKGLPSIPPREAIPEE